MERRYNISVGVLVAVIFILAMAIGVNLAHK